jgi:hypothetical protein
MRNSESNMEHYRKDILQVIKDDDDGYIAKVNGEIVPCREATCPECEFNERGGCERHAILWLMADYKPEITLTAREKHFVECMEEGWLARDKKGELMWYAERPYKCGIEWDYIYGGVAGLNDEYFTFITWEDEQPWGVEDLRKLKALEYNPSDVAFKGGGSDE